MQYIASVLREFDALKIYSEKERIAIIQNGLRDDLRQVVRGHTWNTVHEMDFHLRTTEVAEELHRERKSVNMMSTEEEQCEEKLEFCGENSTNGFESEGCAMMCNVT